MAGIGTLEPDTVADEKIELFHLEQLFEGDATCQLNHQLVGLPCSIVVTTIGNTSCGVQARMCEIGKVVANAYMESGAPCIWCDKAAKECWTLLPA